MFDHIKENEDLTELEKLAQAFTLVMQTAVTHSQHEIDRAMRRGDDEMVVQERIKLRAIQTTQMLFEQCQQEVACRQDCVWQELSIF